MYYTSCQVDTEVYGDYIHTFDTCSTLYRIRGRKKKTIKHIIIFTDSSLSNRRIRLGIYFLSCLIKIIN